MRAHVTAESSTARTATALLAALGLLMSACGDDRPPTSPFQPGEPPAVVALEVAAPERIAPNESVQLTATFVRADGSRENANSQVMWISDGPSLVVSQAGVATGKSSGEAVLTVLAAAPFGVSARVRIFTLPTGTFKLRGTVTDGFLGIANVTVTVKSDAGEVLTRRTAADGTYAIYGVAGSVQVQLEKVGYVNALGTIEVNDHQTFDAQLWPDRSTTSGVYTLTITAGPCNSGGWTLPEKARSRTYTAHVVEEPGIRFSIRATLTGADFVIFSDNGNQLYGFRDEQDRLRIELSRVSTSKDPDDPSDPGTYHLLERLDASSALAIVGRMDTTRTQDAIEGRLSGSFLLIRNPPHGPIEARCDSATHDFEMLRR